MALKRKILRALCLDRDVEEFYYKFQNQYRNYTKENRIKTLIYLLRLNWAQYHCWSLEKVPKPSGCEKYVNITEEYMGLNESDTYFSTTSRKLADELCLELMKYDVISFDIFDTAIFRKVEFPENVFTLMSAEMGFNDFVNIRKKAESEARNINELTKSTREVTLDDIYNIIVNKYGIDASWKQRELDLELDMVVTNPYIFYVYNQLISNGKKVVFTSDMYLSLEQLESMLHKAGYCKYDRIILSNEFGLRKGDGTLQPLLLKFYPDAKLVHIGDNINGDYKRTLEVGIDAVHNPDQRFVYREEGMDNLAGSFYRAVISNKMNNGLKESHSLQYEHGYRVGGILTAGYCEFINRVVKEKNIDKILFCARDCHIIHKAYNKFYKEVANEYINISRYAIFNVAQERYLYDLVNRTILRCADENKNSKTIAEILKISGYEYLIEYLEDDDIDQYRYPCSLNKFREKLEKFVFRHSNIIEKNNYESKAAAIKYFREKIGNAKNILIVDIGWTGTCNTALKYFIESNIDFKINIYGTLLCTSRNKRLTTSVNDGTIIPYVYGPFQNMDIARFIMPENMSAKQMDLLHMPVEYLYTDTEASLVGYYIKEDGSVGFKRAGYSPLNVSEIISMQEGIMDFIADFKEYSSKYERWFEISAYTAFMPLMESIKHKQYTYDVYKNFSYDAFSAVYSDNNIVPTFGSLFDIKYNSKIKKRELTKKQRILFVTPELTYTGTPRSLLRMCKIAQKLGYDVTVWSAKIGSFIVEYENFGISVKIVAESKLKSDSIIAEIQEHDMAVCNTIVTDKYAALCSKFIPTIWYIREATNIPDFCRNNPSRQENLRKSNSICCVSRYAAEAIGQFTDNNIMIIPNCVEDEIEMATSYKSGQGEKIKFVQFGTIEYRKGYDVLVAAYLSMPKTYRDKVELYFAGGFINSGSAYSSYLFSKINNNPNIHYLGVVKGEKKKIETLSSMDVVVVASRDESCSLVALEGAMLAKPLIVTENVGAKYIVNDNNGFVVKTGDVASLAEAMMQLVDNQENLYDMGCESRKQYELFASMDAYTSDMRKLYSLCNCKDLCNLDNYKKDIEMFKPNNTNTRDYLKYTGKEKVIVSLTSHPGRINVVGMCIKTLLQQTHKPFKVLLWLSKEQFKNGDDDLPESLKDLQNSVFVIKWTEDNLMPHKKYYYAMQEYTEIPLITVDDDVLYDEKMVEILVKTHLKHKNCVIAMRANMIMFNANGEIRKYDNWVYNCKFLTDTPSAQLLPTGVGGVLYPAGSVPKFAFDKEAIKAICLKCDDLWLKFATLHNGYKVVVPKEATTYKEIEGSQDVALWKTNVGKNNNDISLDNILVYYKSKNLDCEALVKSIMKDNRC